MRTTKVFKSGNSMAVRLPKDFQLHGDEVEIIRQGNGILIREIPKNLSEAFSLFQALPDDFFSEGRTDSLPQERDNL